MENKNIIRFEFAKKGGLKYISHLDLQRTFLRIIKRSHIPIRYTEGFNPHPKLVFALTVSVGSESECELVDVYMKFDSSRQGVPLFTDREFEKAIKPNLPKGFDFVSVSYADKPFSDITHARYEITLEGDITPEQIGDILSQPVDVMRKTKKGESLCRINDFIEKYECQKTDDGTLLCIVLSASQNAYLNPEYIIEGIKSKNGMNEKIKSYDIVRKEIIFSSKS